MCVHLFIYTTTAYLRILALESAQKSFSELTLASEPGQKCHCVNIFDGITSLVRAEFVWGPTTGCLSATPFSRQSPEARSALSKKHVVWSQQLRKARGLKSFQRIHVATWPEDEFRCRVHVTWRDTTNPKLGTSAARGSGGAKELKK